MNEILKKAKLKKLQSQPLQDDLFHFERDKFAKSIQELREAVAALERCEFNYYVPPTHINKIKNWIRR